MNCNARQVTTEPGGKILTNTGLWSPDGKWLVYDTRSDAEGERFDGQTICIVNVETGEVRRIFESKNGAFCGVATFHPHEAKVVFILGPENPTPDWQYNAYHRQGVIVEVARPGIARHLDARDIVPPFTPGALRGGTHVHVWDAAGEWVSFTYEDHVLAEMAKTQGSGRTADVNQRNVGVSIPGRAVAVPRGGAEAMASSVYGRNHDGVYFSVLVTRTTAKPRPGSDEIQRACEEGWVGTNGYVRLDGLRQKHALAFQGQVVGNSGKAHYEVFIVDLAEDLTMAGDGPLCGTATSMPLPPKGTIQRRLTRTDGCRYPGVQGPRHWLRSSPDGSAIAFLMKDDAGIAQLWSVSPNGGPPRQLTTNNTPIGSSFTWKPDGSAIAHVMDRSVCITDTRTGQTTRLTAPTDSDSAPRPEACVFSPDGRQIAYARHLGKAQAGWNQVFVVDAVPGRITP